MSITDFLFNGSPPASTTTYGSSTSSLPAWYNDYTQGLISKANAIASTPYQAYQGARVAGFTDPQTQAFQNVADQTSQYAGGVNSAAFSPANQDLQTAADSAKKGIFSSVPGQQSQQAYNQALGPNVDYNYSQAGNDINRAAGSTYNNMNTSSVDNLQNYMNPYTNNVVNEAGRQGALANQIGLQNVSDQFAGSGQYGGSRMGQAMGNAANLASQQTQGNQNALLNTGYQNALGASQSDLQRRLQASGQLGTQGASLGALAGQQQQGYGSLGSQLAGLSTQQFQNQIAAGNAQAQLAQQAASTGTQQNAALEAIGGQQQNLNQQNLNTAYQDFQNQVQYPQQQASFLNSIIRGLQIPTTQTTSQTGPASVYQASPLAQIAAAGTGIAGLSKLG